MFLILHLLNLFPGTPTQKGSSGAVKQVKHLRRHDEGERQKAIYEDSPRLTIILVRVRKKRDLKRTEQKPKVNQSDNYGYWFTTRKLPESSTFY
jgi:hypothetical protein